MVVFVGFGFVSGGGLGLGFSGSLFCIEDVATDSIITIGGGPGTRDVRLEIFFLSCILVLVHAFC
jgi:hypothetical protein